MKDRISVSTRWYWIRRNLVPNPDSTCFSSKKDPQDERGPRTSTKALLGGSFKRVHGPPLCSDSSNHKSISYWGNDAFTLLSPKVSCSHGMLEANKNLTALHSNHLKERSGMFELGKHCLPCWASGGMHDSQLPVRWTRRRRTHPRYGFEDKTHWTVCQEFVSCENIYHQNINWDQTQTVIYWLESCEDNLIA
jgi:hypothetical protein